MTTTLKLIFAASISAVGAVIFWGAAVQPAHKARANFAPSVEIIF